MPHRPNLAGPHASSLDLLYNDEPKCPHCGADDQDWSDGLNDSKNDGDEWEATCGECMRVYKVTMCVEVTFSTEKPPSLPKTVSDHDQEE